MGKTVAGNALLNAAQILHYLHYVQIYFRVWIRIPVSASYVARASILLRPCDAIVTLRPTVVGTEDASLLL